MYTNHLLKKNLQFISLVQCRLHREQVFAEADIFSIFNLYKLQLLHLYGNNLLFTHIHIERTEGIKRTNCLERRKSHKFLK